MDSVRRLFLFVQLPLIVIATVLFAIGECGDRGTLDNTFLRTSIYPTLRRLEGVTRDAFDADAAAVVADLERLRALLER